MTTGNTRALLSIVLALVASLALVWLRRSARADSETDVASSTNQSLHSKASLEPRLTETAPIDARVEQATLTFAAKPEPSAESFAPPGLAGTGMWLRLIDDQGEAKSGIRLEVDQELWLTLGQKHSDRRFIERLVTDAGGRVRLAATQASEIVEVALETADGSSVNAAAPFEFAPGSTDEILLLYPESATIRARAFDLSGAPTTGALIQLMPCNVAANSAGAHTFVTQGSRIDMYQYLDAEGRCSFEVIAGWYSLSALGAGVSETLRIGIVAPTRSADVALYFGRTERTVRVHLVSSTRFDPADVSVGARGEPNWPSEARVEGVSIERLRGEKQFLARHVGGAWQLNLPRGGTWKVQAGGEDFEPAIVDLPPDANEITLTLVPKPRRPEVVLSGRVVDAAGNPPRDLTRVMLLRLVDLWDTDVVEAAADGTFRMLLREIAPDRTHAYLMARRDDEASGGLGPIALERSRGDLVLVLRPGLEIAGRVNGLPPGVEATITIYSRPSRFEHAEVPVATEWLPRSLESGEWGQLRTWGGEFSESGMPAGEYELWVEPLDRITPPARQRVTAGDRDVVVELGRGLEGGLTLLCRVVDDATSAPVSGAEIYLYGAETGVWPTGSIGRTNANGTCTLYGHVAGRWHVSVRALGFAHPPWRFTEFATSEQFVEVRLSRACTLDLQFTDSFGTPRSGVSVCATTLQGELLFSQDRYGNRDNGFTESDTSGRVAARGLPAGRVRIVAGWKDGARVEMWNHDGAYSLANPLGLPVFEHDLEPQKRAIVSHVLR